MEPSGQPTEPRDYDLAQQPTSELPHPLSRGDPGYDPRLYIGGWVPKRPRQRPSATWQPVPTGQPSGTAYPVVDQKTQQRNGCIALSVIALVALIVSGVVVSCHNQSSSGGAPALSNEPVTACDGISNKLWSNAPGTLAAQVNRQAVTHFYSDSSLTLTYTGTSGDSFAVSTADDGSFLPTTVGIEAVPYFDGSAQFADATSTSVPITQRNIHGSTLTISVRFPFPHPTATPDNSLLQTGGTPYTKPGPYCFNVNIPYTRPDGGQDVGATFVGLYEEPAAE